MQPGELVLTLSEIVILKLIARGCSNQELANQTDMSLKSIDLCKARAMNKLTLNSHGDVVRYARNQGWLADG